MVVSAAFGLTVSDAKTEIICLCTRGMLEPTAIFSVEAVGHVYNQTNEFVYLSGGMSNTMPTCPSRSTGAYATHGATSEVYPRTVRPTVPTPRAQNTDAKRRGTRDKAVRAASRGVHARATTTRCAEPTKASSPAASVSERTIAQSPNFVYLDTLMMTS